MAKLTNLVDLTARIAAVPRKSAKVWGAGLRKAGMISKFGRGPHAADMVASDAANMLLAAMQFGAAVEIAQTVNRLRELPFFSFKIDPGVDREWRELEAIIYAQESMEGDRHPTFRDMDETCTLGKFLDRMIRAGNSEGSAVFENRWDRVRLEQTTHATKFIIELAEREYGVQDDGWHSEKKKGWKFEFSASSQSEDQFGTRRSTEIYCESLRALAELIRKPALDKAGAHSVPGPSARAR